jgi:hypothetical protein
MHDCTQHCAGYGADCRDCVQTSDPTEQPSLYRPKPEQRESAPERNEADCLDTINNRGR